MLKFQGRTPEKGKRFNGLVDNPLFNLIFTNSDTL